MESKFQTHPVVCEYMVDMIPHYCRTVLEPTPGEGNLVREFAFLKYSPKIQFGGASECLLDNPLNYYYLFNTREDEYQNKQY